MSPCGDHEPPLLKPAVAPEPAMFPPSLTLLLLYNTQDPSPSAPLNQDLPANSTPKKIRTAFGHYLLSLLGFSSLAMAAPPTNGPATFPNPSTTIQTTPFKPSQQRLSEDHRTDILIFGIGTITCIVLVVGTRYSRRGWQLPAPIMGVSSVAFFVLKNDAGVNSTVIWMAFAIWSTATLTYVWTAKDRLPANRFVLFILSSTAFMGMLAYIFAPVLQEPTATAIPIFAAFSVYVCKVALQSCASGDRTVTSSSSFHEGYAGRQFFGEGERFVRTSLSPV